MRRQQLLSFVALSFLSSLAAGQSSNAIDLKSELGSAYGLQNQKSAWIATGTAFVHGAHQKFTLTFDPSFRYRLDVSGALPQSDGFDGRTTWTEGPAGVAHPTYTLERDAMRLAMWGCLGFWADKKAPLQTMPDADTPTTFSRAVKPKDGKLSARLAIDVASGLATSLTYDAAEGKQVWECKGFRDFQGRTLPTHIVLHSGQQDDIYDIQDVEPISQNNVNYSIPKTDQGEFAYDASIPPQVEVKRVGGYLFIHPKVGGEDVGWFFLDSGADVMCLDPTICKKLSLNRVGSDTTAGVVAVAQLGLYQGVSFQIGPAEIKKPVYLEFDVKDLTAAFGIQVAGVCGYDLFARTIVDVNPNSKTICLYDPNQNTAIKGVHWTAMDYSGNAPVVEGAFAPDHRGLFHLDTGSGNTVDFFSPTVDKYGLGTGKDVTQSKTGGAGGSATSLSGHIDWFELAGVRISKPVVGFQTAQAGVFATAFEDGNIGMGFMSKFHMVFDYPHQRVGFGAPGR